MSTSDFDALEIRVASKPERNTMGQVNPVFLNLTNNGLIINDEVKNRAESKTIFAEVAEVSQLAGVEPFVLVAAGPEVHGAALVQLFHDLVTNDIATIWAKTTSTRGEQTPKNNIHRK